MSYRAMHESYDGWKGEDPSQEAGHFDEDDRFDSTDKLRATKARIRAAVEGFYQREQAKKRQDRANGPAA